MRLATGSLLAVLLLVVSSCGPRGRPPKVYPPLPGGTMGAVRVRTDGGIRSVALEDYVAGCLAAELGSPRASDAAGERMRQVQAILCRSYAVASRGRHASAGFDVCATTHCQLYRPAPGTDAGRLAGAAADETRGRVILFQGRVVRPVYHANCGGAVSAAHDVWPGPPVPWLVSLEESVCERGPGWAFTVDLGRMGRALAADGRLGFRPPLRDVKITGRDSAGRAKLVQLVGSNTVVVRGDELRAALLRTFGASSLGSTRFSIARSGSRLTFRGHGHGHGVGLCQAGALRLASRGQSPEAILAHYFPGTEIGVGNHFARSDAGAYRFVSGRPNAWNDHRNVRELGPGGEIVPDPR